MRNVLALGTMVIACVPGFAFGDTMAAMKRLKAGAFDASAEMRCAQEVGQALGSCVADVARSDGAAAVRVTFPNGFARILSFADGAFLRGNATMSGVGTDTDWHLDDGMHHIRVDDQRFEIPDALVFGQ